MTADPDVAKTGRRPRAGVRATRRVEFWLTEEEFALIAEDARAEDVTVNDYARDATCVSADEGREQRRLEREERRRDDRRQQAAGPWPEALTDRRVGPDRRR
jgi:hypothetical protein